MKCVLSAPTGAQLLDTLIHIRYLQQRYKRVQTTETVASTIVTLSAFFFIGIAIVGKSEYVFFAAVLFVFDYFVIRYFMIKMQGILYDERKFLQKHSWMFN